MPMVVTTKSRLESSTSRYSIYATLQYFRLCTANGLERVMVFVSFYVFVLTVMHSKRRSTFSSCALSMYLSVCLTVSVSLYLYLIMSFQFISVHSATLVLYLGCLSMSVCLSVRLFVSLFVCPPVCLFVCLL